MSKKTTTIAVASGAAAFAPAFGVISFLRANSITAQEAAIENFHKIDEASKQLTREPLMTTNSSGANDMVRTNVDSLRGFEL